MKFLAALCCSPVPKRKPSTRVANLSATEIPVVTPPAPPPSRALHYGEAIETENEIKEATAEVRPRIRYAGRTAELHGLPKDSISRSVASFSSLLVVKEPDPESRQANLELPLRTLSRVESLAPSAIFHHSSEFNLGGVEALMTKPSGSRYCEDIADRNNHKYNPSGSPAPSANSGDQSMLGDALNQKDTAQLTDLPRSKPDRPAAARGASFSTINEYEGHILGAPDLGQFAQTLHQDQPSSWKTPDARPYNDPSRKLIKRIPPSVRMDSVTTYLGTNSPPDPVFKSNSSRTDPGSLGRGERRLETTSLPQILEPLSDEDDDGKFERRKGSGTPSVGVSRYSTARADIGSD